MKLKVILLAILPFALTNCKKSNETAELLLITPERLAGLWVPFGITEHGSYSPGNFVSNNIFGAYNESVQINTNRTFIPVTYTDSDHIFIDTDEKGVYTFSQINRKLTTDGSWKTEWTVVKLTADEMWLSTNQITWKFRKQP
jgi:hypothetical protein